MSLLDAILSHWQPGTPLAPVYLCGPTASGKSALAVELAQRIGGEIVNADAFQLYQGLEILSAAPSAEERAQVPHHLYGVLSPADACDAQKYASLVQPLISQILARSVTPVVTGGSGLYLKFLTHGASPLPTGDAALRAEMDATPLEALVAELQALDPVEAGRTHLRNRRYVSRALEICKLSGQKASDLRDRWQSANAHRDASLRGFVLQRSRDALHSRIARRTRAMLDSGAVEEVRALSSHASATLSKAIGFREIEDLLAGRTDRAACEERIAAATRQYAKRQETWFRRERWLAPVRAD